MYDVDKAVEAQGRDDALKGEISIFQEQYNYNRACGMSHLEARCRAIDYYRRYTKREVTATHENEFGESVSILSNTADDSTSMEEHVSFNDLVEKLAAKVTNPKALKLMWLLIKKEGLDEHLDAENMANMKASIGSSTPETVDDLSRELGFAFRSPRIYAYFNCLGEFAKNFR